MNTELGGSYICPVCFQINEIDVDVSAGNEQTFTEDCAVCCHPNVLRVVIESETGEVSVEAESES